MTSCLIVDDSKTIRRIILEIMEEIGRFECREAEDGQKACERCAEAMPDIILLDWNMPVMDGMQCLTKLRAMENGTHPKVIFCTTENDLNFIQRAIQAGADEYIMKPFDRLIVETKLIQLGVIEGYGA